MSIPSAMAWRADHVGRRDARAELARVDYDVRERSEYIDSPANEIHDGATRSTASSGREIDPSQASELGMNIAAF
jgi:hypothetical protein